VKDAKQLADLLKGIKCKINLLPFNKRLDGKSQYDSPDQHKVDKFHEYLISRNFSVFTRKQRGIDISASCGQLTAS
jgi:23S rRNA (adenine2503-C2)-methyltransferase